MNGNIEMDTFDKPFLPPQVQNEFSDNAIEELGAEEADEIF